MLAGRRADAQGGFAIEILGEKIGNQEGHAALAADPRQEIHCGGDVGTRMLRHEGEDLANQTPDVRRSFFGGDVAFHLIGEENRAGLVVVADGVEGQDGGHLGGGFALDAGRGAESPRGAHVHEEHDHLLALFAITLDEGSAHACRHLPVDTFDVIAGRVFAHLFELDACPTEDRPVLAGHDRVDHAAGLDMDLLDLLDDIWG
ncbi:hypothetical protein DESC_720145 [Desulfosarcina cetonica]|nr:hypothetical protein DESC_720145 [Desulfosarcina cetonica]